MKNPKKHSDAMLIDLLSAEELLNWSKRTSVDSFLPKLLLEVQVDCYVVNGKHPERIEAILTGQQATYTLIVATTE